jgi:hypothetical protein
MRYFNSMHRLNLINGRKDCILNQAMSSHRVGLNLARVAPPIAVANILSRYDLEFTPTPSGKERYLSVTAPREDLMVRFLPRA